MGEGKWIDTESGKVVTKQPAEGVQLISPDVEATDAVKQRAAAYEAAVAPAGGVRTAADTDNGTTEAANEGKVDAILDRVGNDATAARQVLEAEQAADKPRAGLVRKLEEVIAADVGADDPSTMSPQTGEL